MVAAKSKKVQTQTPAVKADSRSLAVCGAAAFLVACEMKAGSSAFLSASSAQTSSSLPSGSHSSSASSARLPKANNFSGDASGNAAAIGSLGAVAMLLAAGARRNKSEEVSSSRSSKVSRQFFGGDFTPAKPAFDPATALGVQEP
eukprot:CAMPEP_0178385638 /NCGR_PEP_ID=MMETSP0689_2-20121128/8133_1 /TAXON_ID=160604 /ORGANISM="Amphidinium massartii, Strain CS-259" /LENGTH=144 /DNA_ID=CAMNT_0020005921 /DNA_START=34 /DNA_END=464 /DNA_ORIENTATION=-